MPERPTPWRPLLTGELADQAWAAVRDIARALEATPDGAGAGPYYEGRGASVAGGRAGLALFHAYLAEALLEAQRDAAESDRQAEIAGRRLDEAIEALATTPMSVGLYSGFPGVAWAAEHLGRRFEPDGDEAGGDEDPNAEIDEALGEALARSPWNDQYDLISGLVGLGVYAVERYPRPSGIRCLEAVVDRLDESAERRPGRDGEATWFTPPEMLPAETRERTPHGYYNLGVAHGVPGVIAVLAEACRLGVREERARPLLEGAVRWLLGQRLPEPADPTERGRFCYASWMGEGIEPRPARLAWCYGDPGIAATLLAAARSVGREDWERAALEIAAGAASAPFEQAGVRDAGLCHGALGLAHLYNRIHQSGAGDSKLFADAARLWVRHGLDLRNPEHPLAGFAAWQPAGENRELGWVDDPGFLTGVAGIGLALLAVLTDIEPEWDRLLQVDIPPLRP